MALLKTRRVLVDIDAILNLFKDYTQESGDIPQDAMPVKFMIKPEDRGKLGILIQSPTLEPGPPIPITFHLKRVYGL
jgi:hypothetical protein